jgi:hypothetical protein
MLGDYLDPVSMLRSKQRLKRIGRFTLAGAAIKLTCAQERRPNRSRPWVRQRNGLRKLPFWGTTSCLITRIGIRAA